MPGRLAATGMSAGIDVTAAELWLAALVAAAISYFSCRWLVRHAHRLGLSQEPNHRSSHSVRTAHGGGLGIGLASVFTLSFLGAVHPGAGETPYLVVLLSLIIAGVGLWDDIRPMPVLPRLIVHGLVSAGLIWAVGGQQAWGMAIMLFLAAVWWINLFNFMDGIDGLAASQALFMLLAGLGLGSGGGEDLVWAWMIVTAAATAGFLIWNWSPAKLFMGDVGSTWLAFTLLYFCLQTTHSGWMTFPAWLILGALFIVDATSTLIVRIARGEPWLQAHRSHIYQLLARKWGGHRPVTLSYLAANVLLLAPLAWLALHRPESGWLIVLALYGLLGLVSVLLRPKHLAT